MEGYAWDDAWRDLRWVDTWCHYGGSGRVWVDINGLVIHHTFLPTNPPTPSPLIPSLPHSKQVENSRKEAQTDGITVPTTVDEYCLQHKKQQTSSIDMTDDYFDRDDDYYQDYSSSDSEGDNPLSSEDEGGDQVDGDSGTA